MPVNLIDSLKNYDIGDIYIGYGSPRTSTIYMHYNWGPRSEDSAAMYIDNLDKKEADAGDMDEDESSMNSESKCNKEKSLNFEEGQEDEDDDFDDFDPLEYLGVYKEKLLSSDDDGDVDPADYLDYEPLFDDNLGKRNPEDNKLSFFDNTMGKDNISITSNENYSKCLNFSDINSKLKNSNLSLNGDKNNTSPNDKKLNISFPRVVDDCAKDSPKKKRRIAFVSNVSPKDKGSNVNKVQTTESVVEKVNSNVYNEKYSSVTSKSLYNVRKFK
jgi:hypothetical protein